MSPRPDIEIDPVERVAKMLQKKYGLFSDIVSVSDKETMKWILIKFLKETMEFLSTNEDARKTQRGKLVERWINENLNLPGEYSSPPSN